MVAIWFRRENFSRIDHVAKNDTNDLISLSNCNPPNRLNLDLIDAGGSSSEGQVIIPKVGTIDYTTGKVVINAMSIKTIVSGLDYVYITIDVDEDDVHVAKGQVVTIQDADISVSMVEDVT